MWVWDGGWVGAWVGSSERVLCGRLKTNSLFVAANVVLSQLVPTLRFPVLLLVSLTISF